MSYLQKYMAAIFYGQHKLPTTGVQLNLRNKHNQCRSYLWKLFCTSDQEWISCTTAMSPPVVCPKQSPKFSMHPLRLLEINFHFLRLFLQYRQRNKQYTTHTKFMINKNDTKNYGKNTKLILTYLTVLHLPHYKIIYSTIHKFKRHLKIEWW